MNLSWQLLVNVLLVVGVTTCACDGSENCSVCCADVTNVCVNKERNALVSLPIRKLSDVLAEPPLRRLLSSALSSTPPHKSFLPIWNIDNQLYQSNLLIHEKLTPTNSLFYSDASQLLLTLAKDYNSTQTYKALRSLPAFQELLIVHSHPHELIIDLHRHVSSIFTQKVYFQDASQPLLSHTEELHPPVCITMCPMNSTYPTYFQLVNSIPSNSEYLYVPLPGNKERISWMILLVIILATGIMKGQHKI